MTTVEYDQTPLEYKRALGVFPRRVDAESALASLQDNDFPLDKLSVIAKDSGLGDEMQGVEVKEKAGQSTGDTASVGAVTGGALGSITGLLVGLGTLAIPGVGPVVLAGITASALATTLAGGLIGATAGVLVGALVSLGVPEERAIVYNNYVAKGYYLVIVDGTVAEIQEAETILNGCGIQRWEIFFARNSKQTGLKNILPSD